MPHIQLPYGITDYNNKQIKLNLPTNDKSKVLFSQLPYLANFENLIFQSSVKDVIATVSCSRFIWITNSSNHSTV